MKQVVMLALAAGLAMSVVPAEADAQGNRNRERGRVEQRDRGNGPAFCRSGEGHPVFGRQWCRDKGFGLGNDRYDRRDDRYDRYPDRRGDDRYDRRPGRIGDYPRQDGNVTWRRADFGDVTFRFSGSLPGRELSRSQLESLLGNRTIARLTRHAYETGATGELYGVWTDTNPLVLRVFAGRVPVAEFEDRNLDRRVDRVNLAYWK